MLNPFRHPFSGLFLSPFKRPYGLSDVGAKRVLLAAWYDGSDLEFVALVSGIGPATTGHLSTMLVADSDGTHHEVPADIIVTEGSRIVTNNLTQSNLASGWSGIGVAETWEILDNNVPVLGRDVVINELSLVADKIPGQSARFFKIAAPAVAGENAVHSLYCRWVEGMATNRITFDCDNLPYTRFNIETKIVEIGIGAIEDIGDGFLRLTMYGVYGATDASNYILVYPGNHSSNYYDPAVSAGEKLYIGAIQVENSTGRVDTTTLSDYIPTIDQPVTKSYVTANGNEVINNVVTEAEGALLNPAPSQVSQGAGENGVTESWDFSAWNQGTVPVTLVKDQTSLSGVPNSVYSCEDDSGSAESINLLFAFTASVGTVKAWIKKDIIALNSLRLILKNGATSFAGVDFAPSTGEFLEVQYTTEITIVEVIDDGVNWLLIFETDAIGDGLQLNPAISMVIPPDGTTSSAATGIASIIQVEFHAGKTIDEVRNLLPIVTSGAAAPTDPIVNKIPIDNVANIDYAFTAEIKTDGSQRAFNYGLTYGLGPELAINGEFNNSAIGWTGTYWTWESPGVYRHESGAGYLSSAYQDILSVDEIYLINYEMGDLTAGTLKTSAGSNAGTINNLSGLYTETLKAESDGIIRFTPSEDYDGWLDNVSVRKFDNNTSYQLTDSEGNVVSMPAIDGEWNKVGFNLTADVTVDVPLDPVVTFPYPIDDTAVLCATEVAGYFAWYGFREITVLTGAGAGYNFMAQYGLGHARVGIDYEQSFAVTEILLENYHSTGLYTNRGIKDFKVYGTDSAVAFASSDPNDLTDLTEVGTFIATEHPATDTADPQTFAVNNDVSFAYYVMIVTTTHGATNYYGFRNMVLKGNPEPIYTENIYFTRSLDNKVASVNSSAAWRSSDITGCVMSSALGGKFYYEFNIIDPGYYLAPGDATQVGLRKIRQSDGNRIASSGYAYISTGHKQSLIIGLTAYGSQMVAGDVIGVMVDCDNGAVEFKHNDVSQGVAFSGLTIDESLPSMSGYAADQETGLVINAADLTYDIPAGYQTFDSEAVIDTMSLTVNGIKGEDAPYSGRIFDENVEEVLGNEKVINGNFDIDTTGWTPASSSILTVVNQHLDIENTSAWGQARQTVAVVAGVTNRLTLKFYGTLSDSDLLVRVGSLAGGEDYLLSAEDYTLGDQELSFDFTPTGVEAHLSFETNTATIPAHTVIDNVSTKEITTASHTADPLQQFPDGSFPGRMRNIQGMLGGTKEDRQEFIDEAHA